MEGYSVEVRVEGGTQQTVDWQRQPGKNRSVPSRPPVTVAVPVESGWLKFEIRQRGFDGTPGALEAAQAIL